MNICTFCRKRIGEDQDTTTTAGGKAYHALCYEVARRHHCGPLCIEHGDARDHSVVR